jgi:hypothetical protein
MLLLLVSAGGRKTAGVSLRRSARVTAALVAEGNFQPFCAGGAGSLDPITWWSRCVRSPSKSYTKKSAFNSDSGTSTARWSPS